MSNKNIIFDTKNNMPIGLTRYILLFISKVKSLFPINFPRLFTKNYLLSFVASHIVFYPSPAILTYAWSFGSLAGLCLVIQILSGIFLSMVRLVLPPLASCATNLSIAIYNSNISNYSVLIKKARENILEFLLLNCILDYPIFDHNTIQIKLFFNFDLSINNFMIILGCFFIIIYFILRLFENFRSSFQTKFKMDNNNNNNNYVPPLVPRPRGVLLGPAPRPRPLREMMDQQRPNRRQGNIVPARPEEILPNEDNVNSGQGNIVPARPDEISNQGNANSGQGNN